MPYGTGGVFSLGRQEVHEPLYNWDVARDPRSNPRGKVSWLVLYLGAVQTALAALEQETADAWATTADAQARTIGKVSFIEKLCPIVHGLVLPVLVLLALEEELSTLREAASSLSMT